MVYQLTEDDISFTEWSDLKVKDPSSVLGSLLTILLILS